MLLDSYKKKICLEQQNINQLYVLPHTLLRPYIAHYTFSSPDKNQAQNISEMLSIIPDASGCIVLTFTGSELEIIFWGSTTQIVQVSKNMESIPIRIFIEFLPAGAFHFIGISQTECTNKQIPLKDLNPNLHQNLTLAFEEAHNMNEFRKQMDILLLTCLYEHSSNTFLQFLLSDIRKNTEIPLVSDIAKENSCSQRQLNRITQSALGMSMKKYLQIVRINRITQELKQAQGNLTVLAHNHGYYDQAHFIHDFAAFYNMNPSTFLKNMSNFYNEPYKF